MPAALDFAGHNAMFRAAAHQPGCLPKCAVEGWQAVICQSTDRSYSPSVSGVM